MLRCSGIWSCLCRQVTAFVLVGLGVLSASQAWANCPTRHFYNNEVVPFWLVMSKGSCTTYNSPMMSKCIVQPGQVAEIHYGNLTTGDVGAAVIAGLNKALKPGGDAPGLYTPDAPEPDFSQDVSVTSADGGRTFGTTSFILGDHCNLVHQDDTSMLVMNDPTNGDITVACRGNCVNIKRFREETDRVHELHERATQHQAEMQDEYQWGNIDITLRQQDCFPRGHNNELVLADCHRIRDRFNSSVMVEARLRHPLSCKGQIENADGKLVCIDLWPHCEHYFSSTPSGPGVNITCSTQTAGVKPWSLLIAKDCDVIWVGDTEKRDAYPICKSLP